MPNPSFIILFSISYFIVILKKVMRRKGLWLTPNVI